MLMTSGIDRNVLVREARNATRLALAISSGVAGFMPRIFFWLGQMRTQTLKSMMVPNHAPTPISIADWLNVSPMRPSVNASPKIP